MRLPNLTNIGTLRLRCHQPQVKGRRLLCHRFFSIASPKSRQFDFEQVFRTGTPPEFFNFASDVFDSHVVETPAKLALWMDSDSHSKQWTWAQLRTESVRAALTLSRAIDPTQTKSLKSRRMPADTTIFILLPRVPEWWFIHLASLRLGTVISPATTLLTPEDIAYRLQASKAGVVITDDENMWKIEEAQRLAKLEKSPVKIVVPKKRRIEHITAESWVRYDDLAEDVADCDILAFRNAETKSSDISQIYFTSGTTGKPKRVGIHHSCYGIGHYQTTQLMNIKSNDLFWNVSDPGWAKSAYGNFYAPWTAGAGVYIHQMERFQVAKVLEILRTRPITGFCAPPTLFRAIVQENDPALFKFMSLQKAVTAGEALQPDVIRAWVEKTKVHLEGLYGQTECTAAIGYRKDDNRKEHSMGLANFGYDIRITDDNGVELPVGTEGNLAIKVKPQRPIGLFKGYVKDGSNPLEIDANHKAFVGNFYLTGDRGMQDEEGHFYYVGRADDVIISAGYRIGPSEIESVLQRHPAVAENAVVASPCRNRGSVVKAYIVLAAEHKDTEESGLINELKTFCKLHTAPYKYPRRIEFVTELPKTISGKIIRRELKRREEERYRDQIPEDPVIAYAQDHCK